MDKDLSYQWEINITAVGDTVTVQINAGFSIIVDSASLLLKSISFAFSTDYTDIKIALNLLAVIHNNLVSLEIQFRHY